MRIDYSAVAAPIANQISSGLTGQGGTFANADAVTQNAINGGARALVSAVTRLSIQGGKLDWEAVAADTPAIALNIEASALTDMSKGNDPDLVKGSLASVLSVKAGGLADGLAGVASRLHLLKSTTMD